MTLRQRLLKWFYPALMRAQKGTAAKQTKQAGANAPAPVSFYSLKAVQNNGSELDFSSLQGKKVLIVNTASNCGYTAQYKALQELYAQQQDKLVILGFPANDFKEQEKGSDAEIAQFCEINFGVKFPLMKKSQVVAGEAQNPVYQWLTQPAQNGWNSQQPVWNFSKYLIDENGQLVNYFPPAVEPGEVLQNA